MADEALFQFLHSEIIQYVNSAETGESVRAGDIHENTVTET